MSPIQKINLSAMVKKKNTDKTPENDNTSSVVVDVPVINDNDLNESTTETHVSESVFKSAEEKSEEIKKTKIKKEKTIKADSDIDSAQSVWSELESNTEVVENIEANKEVEQIDEKPSLMPKISLSSIKTTKSIVEIKEETVKEKVDEHARKKEELLEVLEWENINTENTTSTNEIKQEDNIKEETETNEEETSQKSDEEKMLELQEIEKKINEKVEEEVNKKLKKGSSTENGEAPEVLDDKKELFWNYKSEFIEKEETIIEKVETEKKKFSDRIRLPKTRVLLVVWLIVLTIGIIGTMFKIDPKNHSIEIYKNAIVKNVNTVKTNYIVKPWVLEVITIDGYSFNTYTQKQVIKWSKYKYNEIVYDTKAKMDEVINSEVMLIKQAEAERKAEQDRIEAERINQAAATKNKITREKIKLILQLKYNELIKLYQQ